MGYRFSNPLVERNATDAMKRIFSDDTKYGGWRRLWTEYADSLAQVTNGKVATQEEVSDLRSKMDPSNIDYDAVRKIEEKKGHDVVSHATHFKEQACLCLQVIFTEQQKILDSCKVKEKSRNLLGKRKSGLLQWQLKEILIVAKEL
jgi:adenylosuccinate lyase